MIRTYSILIVLLLSIITYGQKDFNHSNSLEEIDISTILPDSVDRYKALIKKHEAVKNSAKESIILLDSIILCVRGSELEPVYNLQRLNTIKPILNEAPPLWLSEQYIGCYLNFAYVEEGKFQFEKAFNYADTAYQLSVKFKNHDLSKSSANLAGVIAYNMSNSDKMNYYFRIAYELAKKDTNNEAKAKAIMNFGQIFSLQGELDSAKVYYREALHVSKQINDSLSSGVIVEQIGLCDHLQGNYVEAIEHFESALQFLPKFEKYWTGDVHKNLGTTYLALDEFGLSKKHFLKALQVIKKSDNPMGEVDVRMKIGDLFLEMEEYDSARYYYDQCLLESNKISYTKGVYSAKGNIAKTLLSTDNSTSAIPLLIDARSLAFTAGDMLGVSSLELSLANAYFLDNDISKAESYGLSALEFAQQNQYQEHIAKMAELLKQVYEQKGNWEKAYEMAEMSRIATLEIHREDNLKAIYKNQYKLKSSQDSIQRVIDSLNLIKQKAISNAEIAQKDLTLERSNFYIFLITAGSIIVILILILVYFRSKVKQGKRIQEIESKKQELKQMALRAQMNPHFLFNALNSIQSVYADGNTKEANDYLASFGSLLRRILDHSSKELIYIKEEIELINLYLGQEQNRTEGQINYLLEVNDEIDPEFDQIPPLIIQPVIENAIWHGIIPSKREGTVKIIFHRPNETTIQIDVIDDGVGFNTSQSTTKNHESKALKIAKDRLGSNGEIIILSELNKGTKVSIKIIQPSES